MSNVRHMSKTFVRITLSAGIGAIIGLIIAVWTDRGKFSILNLADLTIGWLVISLLFSAIGVVVFWVLPSLTYKLLKKLY